MLRVAGGASSVLVGVYIADLANRGLNIGAGLVGTLAAISFGAELLGAVIPSTSSIPNQSSGTAATSVIQSFPYHVARIHSTSRY